MAPNHRRTVRENASAAITRGRRLIANGLTRASSTVRTTTTTLALAVLVLIQPALAQPEGCSPPSEIQPVFDLLEAITQVTMMGGLTIAALGIAIGGVFFMWPGQDMNRRAKSTITYTIIGTVVILAAHAIVAFVTSQMGGAVC